MNSQVYNAASGLIVERRRLDMIASNLANVSTPGYRAHRLFAIPFGSAQVGVSSAGSNVGVVTAGSYEVPGRGPVRETGRALDLDLGPDVFLVVRTSAGTRYARGGSLQISPERELTDAAGNPVLGSDNKPISGLGPGTTVAADGSVNVDGNEVGRLRLVHDPRGVLRRAGDNLLTAEGRDSALSDVEDPTVQAGWLEGSGVDTLGELVRLIEAQRAFEGYQKLISLTMNEVNRRAVNDLAG